MRVVRRGGSYYSLRLGFLNHNIGGNRPPIAHIKIVSDPPSRHASSVRLQLSPGLEPFLLVLAEIGTRGIKIGHRC
jgi:hypothetical protein